MNQRLRFEVFKRDNYTCQMCGKTAQNGARLEVDHKLARNNGGTDDSDNLWTLCVICNRGKRDLYIDTDPNWSAKEGKTNIRQIPEFDGPDDGTGVIIPGWLLKSNRSADYKVVYALMEYYRDGNDEAIISYDTLCKEAKISRGTLAEILDQLEADCFITRTRRGLGLPNIYCLTLDRLTA